MSTNLAQQQSLLRLKLIEAGSRLQNNVVDSYDKIDYEYDNVPDEEVSDASEVSNAESYDTVCNEGPYRPCPARFEQMVTRGTSDANYDDVAKPSLSNFTQKLRKLDYAGYVWGIKEWAIYLLRTRKIVLCRRLIKFLVNIFLDSYAVEIILTLTITIVYITVFLRTSINDDVVYFKSTSLY